MKVAIAQPSFFDPDQSASEAQADATQAAASRARMLTMIDRLTAAAAPPWQDEMAVILDDGAFQRAMRLVPAAEAQSLWTLYDAQMERLYALWMQARLPAET